MPCGDCTAPAESIGELELEPVRMLVDRSHESADVLRCRRCGTTYLYLTCDAFDDTWAYFAPADVTALDELVTIGNRLERFRRAVELLQASEWHVAKPPGGRFAVREEPAEVVHGLPPS